MRNRRRRDAGGVAEGRLRMSKVGWCLPDVWEVVSTSYLQPSTRYKEILQESVVDDAVDSRTRMWSRRRAGDGWVLYLGRVGTCLLNITIVDAFVRPQLVVKDVRTRWRTPAAVGSKVDDGFVYHGRSSFTILIIFGTMSVHTPQQVL